MDKNKLRGLLYEDPPDTLWSRIRNKLPRYYTYMYLREDGTPYYIGKGTGKRVFQKHNVAVPERGRITFQYWEDEAKALCMERWWIDLFGRKNNGTGILRNLTEGGERTPRPSSPEAKERQIAGLEKWRGSEEQKKHIKNILTPEHQSKAGRKGGGKHSIAQKENCRRIASLGGQVAATSDQAATIAHIRWHVNRNKIKKGCSLCCLQQCITPQRD